NRLRGLVARRVVPAVERLDEPPTTDEAAIGQVEAALEAQAACLEPTALSVRGARAVLDGWLDGRAGGEGYWWLEGLALLAAPILPDLARQLWAALGGTGEPTAATLAKPSRPGTRLEVAASPPLRAAELRPYVHEARDAE